MFLNYINPYPIFILGISRKKKSDFTSASSQSITKISQKSKYCKILHNFSKTNVSKSTFNQTSKPASRVKRQTYVK